MNKSLLELLQKEAKFLNIIMLKSSAIEDCVQDKIKNKSEYNRELCDRVISEMLIPEKEKAEENLLEVRKEIKEYFSFIMEL